MKRLFLSVSALALLAACGGGGGGSTAAAPVAAPAAAPVVSAPTLPANKTLSNADGVSATTTNAEFLTKDGSIGGDASGDPTDPIVISDPGARTQVSLVTDASGKITSVVVAQDDVNLPRGFSNRTIPVSPAGSLDAAAIAGMISATGPGTWLAESLSFSAYGLWSFNEASGANPIGTFATGQETPVGAMPTNKTATYNGNAIGFADTSSVHHLAFSADAQVIANFGTTAGGGNVTTNFTGFKTSSIDGGAPGPVLPNLTGSGAITNNTFTSALTGGSLKGTANGTFFGPTANEASGVFKATGGGTNILGSFGTKQ